MKKLLAMLAIAPIFTATPAVADYSACIKFCKEDHNFAYCHKICNVGAIGGERKSDVELAAHLVGNTYMVIDKNFGETIIDVTYFGPDGYTEHMIRTCRGDNYCEGKSEIQDGMVESDLMCKSRNKFVRKFNLGQAQGDFDSFTATTYSHQWGINQGIDMDYVKIKGLSDIPEVSECGS